MKSESKKHAFSMAEILVTLLVISVLLAAAAPMISKRVAPVGNISSSEYLDTQLDELKDVLLDDTTGLRDIVCTAENTYITKCNCAKSNYCKRVGK